MTLLSDIFWKLIEILAESGPYIILGFLIAGVMHVLFPAHLFKKLFGRSGIIPLLRAVGLGALIPVCSCGVVPIGMGAFRSGAGIGTALAFMTAAPTLSPASVWLSLKLLGTEITLWQAFFVTAGSCLLGFVANRFAVSPVPQPHVETTRELVSLEISPAIKQNKNPQTDRQQSAIIQAESGSGPEVNATTSAAEDSHHDCCHSHDVHEKPVHNLHWSAKSKQMLRWVFIDFGPGICLDMLVGLIFAATVLTLVPSSQIAAITGTGSIASLLLVILLALPVYTCSMAAIPVVFGFMSAGMSPGAAVAFIIAGPATNFGAMNVIRGQTGWKTAAYYFLALLSLAVLAGWLIDHLIHPAIPAAVTRLEHHHVHGIGITWIQGICLALLGLMMSIEVIKRLQRRIPALRLPKPFSTISTSSH